MNTNKIIYWIATGALCLMMAGGGIGYFFNYEKMATMVASLNFPLWIIYPLAVAKILGVVAILTRKSELLKEWAYAGFFFDGLLAFGAHQAVGDKEWLGSAVLIILVVVSRYMETKVFPKAA